MMNNISIYYETGEKCRRARREHDEARARWFADWFRRAVALEKAEDKDAARTAYNDGYANG